jgi:hypothetical protein
LGQLSRDNSVIRLLFTDYYLLLTDNETADSERQQQVQRLHRLTVWGRWLFVLGCWLGIGSVSLSVLWDDIALMRQYFTWTALRYALAFNYCRFYTV